jgi:hypothetical protein
MVEKVCVYGDDLILNNCEGCNVNIYVKEEELEFLILKNKNLIICDKRRLHVSFDNRKSSDGSEVH